MTFKLHKQLAADTHSVTILPLCEVRLQNNRLFPWLILVPHRVDVSEIIDLKKKDRTQLMHEISLASKVLKHLYKPDKLNVAALGNSVPQLHLHVIARFKTDSAGDKPVWGGKSEAYAPKALQEELRRLRAAFE